MLVSVNGLIQCPGVDYHATDNSISFSTPPAAGSTITITTPISDSGLGKICRLLEGDGSRYLWRLDEGHKEDPVKTLLKDAWNLRTIPAVADMLERLGVVVELAKQE